MFCFLLHTGYKQIKSCPQTPLQRQSDPLLMSAMYGFVTYRGQSVDCVLEILQCRKEQSKTVSKTLGRRFQQTWSKDPLWFSHKASRQHRFMINVSQLWCWNVTWTESTLCVNHLTPEMSHALWQFGPSTWISWLWKAAFHIGFAQICNTLLT